MQTVVKKWGNSASLRIPLAVMQDAHLAIDQAVDIRVEQGRIVIEPIRPPEYDLEALVASITDENLHDEWDIGPAVGREHW